MIAQTGCCMYMCMIGNDYSAEREAAALEDFATVAFSAAVAWRFACFAAASASFWMIFGVLKPPRLVLLPRDCV